MPGEDGEWMIKKVIDAKRYGTHRNAGANYHRHLITQRTNETTLHWCRETRSPTGRLHLFIFIYHRTQLLRHSWFLPTTSSSSSGAVKPSSYYFPWNNFAHISAFKVTCSQIMFVVTFRFVVLCVTWLCFALYHGWAIFLHGPKGSDSGNSDAKFDKTFSALPWKGICQISELLNGYGPAWLNCR